MFGLGACEDFAARRTSRRSGALFKVFVQDARRWLGARFEFCFFLRVGVDCLRRRRFRVFRFFRGCYPPASRWSACWRFENHEINERNEKKLMNVREDAREDARANLCVTLRSVGCCERFGAMVAFRWKCSVGLRPILSTL